MNRAWTFWIFSLILVLAQATLHGSPFDIGIQPKRDLTSEDYLDVQRRLRQVSIRPLLEEMYVPNAGFTTLDDFENRCSRGIRQTLIDIDRNRLPTAIFEKIGDGGDACFVTCVPYDRDYLSYLTTIVQELQRVSFNGYLLAQSGGFPNPTGEEIRFAAVPYSFKIFMMVEAFQRGFTRVIWIDSAAVPLCNPKSLFDWLDRHPALIRGWPSPHDLWRYIFPRTRELLWNLTRNDVLQLTYVNTIVFGLKMNSELAQALIKEYYYMAELGFPFLSCFPEEFVLSTLLNQPHFRQAWQPAPFRFLVGPASTHESEEAALQRCRNGRCAFFYHRRH